MLRVACMRHAWRPCMLSPSSPSLLLRRRTGGACATMALWLSRRAVHTRDDVRNIAVIAHVDHGKTTLVDTMLSQSGTLSNAHNRVMDSKDQERERGITILAKNTAIVLQSDDKDGNGKATTRRINIVDTPGHLDFSGEVERALQMVEGFVLLVDAKEGVRPGTRYVLRKALALKLHPVVCINKIDKDVSHIDATVTAVQDLFLDLANEDTDLDLTFLYGSGRDGYMNATPQTSGTLQPLFRAIFDRVPAPRDAYRDTTGNKDNNKDGYKEQQSPSQQGLQMLVAQVAYDDKSTVKTAIGRVFAGQVAVGDVVTVAMDATTSVEALVQRVELFRGVERVRVDAARFGDICVLQLQEPVGQRIPLKIGATIRARGGGGAAAHDDVPLVPYRPPDEPTYSLVLQASEASWKSTEAEEALGRITALRARLDREALVNTALQLELADDGAAVTLRGRGPLHLSVLVEDMRREGYEFEVRAPRVLTRVVDGVECEPFERVSLEFRAGLLSDVVSLLSSRFAEIGDIVHVDNDKYIQLTCTLPVRLLSGLPLRFHTMTGGEGVLQHSFDAYRPLSAAVTERDTGALISSDSGEVTEWSLSGHAQQGRFFVLPGDKVYVGQIVGENLKTPLQNLGINVSKRNEQLGGMRANANDKANSKRGAYTAQQMSFEDCVAWIVDDERVTVTPKSVRMRKPSFNGKTTMRTIKRPGQ